MDPFDIFQSSDVYKVVVLYTSLSRGLAIVGRTTDGESVEVIQFSGEVDPATGNFTALDYLVEDRRHESHVITKADFERLVAFVETKIDGQIRMSVIEPEVVRSLLLLENFQPPTDLLH